VVATHGRSLWVLDVTPLRQITAETLKAAAHVYEPKHVVRWQQEVGRDGWFSESNRRFVGQNGASEAQIYYSLGKKASTIALKVLNNRGDTVVELKAGSEPGLHRIAWDLVQRPPRPKPAKPADQEKKPAAGQKPAATPEAEAEPESF